MQPRLMDDDYELRPKDALKHLLIVLSMMVFMSLSVMATINALQVLFDVAWLEVDHCLMLRYPPP